MKTHILVLGTVFAIIGIAALLLSIIAVPFTTLSLEEIPYSTDWINESFVVPEFHFYYYYNLVNFSGRTLHITFNVTEGGSIDFWVMDEADFEKFNASQDFYYYVVPSRPSISKLDIYWTPPKNGTIYFVWDNSFSFTPKSITAHFELEWTQWEYVEVTKNRTLFPSSASYIGILLMMFGIALIGYGFISKAKVQQEPSLTPTTPV